MLACERRDSNCECWDKWTGPIKINIRTLAYFDNLWKWFILLESFLKASGQNACDWRSFCCYVCFFFGVIYEKVETVFEFLMNFCEIVYKNSSGRNAFEFSCSYDENIINNFFFSDVGLRQWINDIWPYLADEMDITIQRPKNTQKKNTKTSNLECITVWMGFTNCFT